MPAVFTNPDTVHHSMLPKHAHWFAFLRRLSFVVVREFDVGCAFDRPSPSSGTRDPGACQQRGGNLDHDHHIESVEVTRNELRTIARTDLSRPLAGGLLALQRSQCSSQRREIGRRLSLMPRQRARTCHRDRDGTEHQGQANRKDPYGG